MHSDILDELYRQYYGTGKTTTGFGQWTLTNAFWGLNREHRYSDFTLNCGVLDTHTDGGIMWQMFPAVNIIDITNTYQYLLEDVQKGVTFKGMWVTGTGEELLSLYESGVVGDIWGTDAYIAL